VVRHQVDKQALRFDVVGISWQETVPHITHVRGAFELPGSHW
jgi:hypothetical protein